MCDVVFRQRVDTSAGALMSNQTLACEQEDEQRGHRS